MQKRLHSRTLTREQEAGSDAENCPLSSHIEGGIVSFCAHAKSHRVVKEAPPCCLARQAGLLGIRPQLFRHARERFEPDDFYRSAL
jgi:hypothetical protein